MGADCASPSRHAEFHDVDSMLDWVELLAAETGLPVGIKSAVGDMTSGTRSIERCERATAASTSSPSTAARAGPVPRRWCSPTRSRCRSGCGFTRVYTAVRRGRAHRRRHVHRLGQARPARQRGGRRSRWARDMVNVAREAMLAIGCIQAQRCHTDKCPTGVATQDPWLVHGLDPGRSPCGSRTTQDAAPRPAQGRRGVRSRAPGLITPRTSRSLDGNRRSVTAGRVVRLPAGLGSARHRGPRGDHPADGPNSSHLPR